MKDKLKQIIENPVDRVICVDMDGTICHGEFWGEGEPEPVKEMVDKITEWYHKGAHIIIYTARQPKYFTLTQAWLMKHGVHFHGIAMMMKPGADLYIDDKALNVEDV